MILGVDYYPEHWPLDMMDEDLERMAQMGVNTVRIGEFAWHLMEPEEGKFDFSFFDKAIAKLKNKGFKVIFGTPTATFPAWLAHKHPDILSQDDNGVPRVFGGRRQYCYTSQTYLSYTEKIVKALVSHFANEETIIAWQVDNEFGHEGSDMCYCDQCHKGFQEFLKGRYASIKELNDIWGTIFWGQTYNDFSEIPIPKKTITVHNPSLQLEWARFRSRTLNRFADYQIAWTKAYKGKHQTMTTNVSGGFFDKWFDHAENVRHLDIVSYDNYPVWGGLREPITPDNIAMTHDFNRGLKDKNYWIVEQLIGAQGHDIIGYLPRPNQAKLWSLQAFSRGCEGMLFFRWRGMNKGAEQFCYGVLDHDNRLGRKYEEAKNIFETVTPFEAFIQAKTQAKVGVYYDYDNIWSWRFQRQSSAFNFTNELLRVYRPFYDLNVMTDVVPIDRPFESYDIITLPVQQIIDDVLANRLNAYVEKGGVLILTFRSGIRDRNNNLHLGQPLPFGIQNMLGAQLEEVESLQTEQFVKLDSKEGESEAIVWRDFLRVNTAKVLATYKGSLMEANAAIVENTYGNGKIVYVGTGASDEVMDTLVKRLCEEKGLECVESPKGVEVVKKTVGNESVHFVMNHNDFEVNWNNEALKAYESKIVML